MSAPRRALSLALALPLVVGAHLAPQAGFAADAPRPTGPPAPAGPPATYRNPELGLTVEGPPGWRLAEAGQGPSSWVALATFSDATTGASVAVSSRRAKAATLPRLRDDITKAYAADKSYTVASITDLAVSGRRPLPGVLVDATQPRAPDPAPAAPSGPAPAPAPAPTPAPAPAPAAPVTWRIQAAYVLGGEWEYEVLAQAKATLFARVAPLFDRVFQNVTVKVAASAFAAGGQGTFRDDVAGFVVRYPEGYGVRIPDRTQHLVEFAPSGGGPVLGVYRYEADADLDHEAKVLTDYYTGPEVGGEAVAGRTQAAGREAALVTARGVVGGREQVFFVVVAKRGTDTFRLRCAADVTQEQAARATFDRFVQSLVLTNPAAPSRD